ncbi:MAG: arginine repressor [Clostridia bacterium]|nr:arginine repressor [Clostridia bacterium]
MARSTRQSKIIEIINRDEIDTQDELVSALKEAGFNVTQATISRDIKELGLFKVSGERKKYKYAVVDNENRSFTNKINDIFKEAVLSIKSVLNQVVIKALRGTTGAVCSIVDRMAMTAVLGCVCGEDTVLIITESEEAAVQVQKRLTDHLENC